MFGSFDEHGIAVTEKAIPGLDGMRVGAPYGFHAGQGRHEHEQGGLRKVEVGQQCVHVMEAIPRSDEQARVTLDVSGDFIVGDLRSGGFKRSHTGCADCDDASARSACFTNGFQRGGTDMEALSMHDVLAQILYAYRLESACA